ncbi:aldo/keto reductase [Archangium violaceum]|uniref:aldo/keto reductase n=1 Tax=Archangium violaceum TaxID=83451 RepID=UPI001950154C|nr:aldo/keto reductase [Archangium violaceum]QRN99601.1 aldo/keto reductase [Archangium violaceum]
MIHRALGNSGTRVSVLGFGAGPVGSPELSESEAEALLNGVLDAGINLLDTAPSYGQSEERKGLDWSELALRFAAFAPGVESCIVGTTKVENLQRNLRAVEKGPLPDALVDRIRGAFRRHDQGWDGLI